MLVHVLAVVLHQGFVEFHAPGMVVDGGEIVFVPEEQVPDVGKRQRILRLVVDFSLNEFNSFLILAHFDERIGLPLKEEFICRVK